MHLNRALVLLGCVLISACAKSRTAGDLATVKASVVVFPHVASFKAKENHGALVRSSPTILTEKCAKCHPFSAGVTGAKSAPGCLSCHNDAGVYPHEKLDGWSGKTVHGSAYLEKKSACTTACHGSDLDGGISGVRCNQCHVSYPHMNGWQHGAEVMSEVGGFDNEKYVNNCSGCHGGKESMTMTFPAQTPMIQPSGVARCYFCHHTFPHVGFKDTHSVLGQIDVKWQGTVSGQGQGGHWYYLLFNVNAPKDMDSWKNPEFGCGSVTGTGCHSVVRKGPTKKSPGCGLGCHPWVPSPSKYYYGDEEE